MSVALAGQPVVLDPTEAGGGTFCPEQHRGWGRVARWNFEGGEQVFSGQERAEQRRSGLRGAGLAKAPSVISSLLG